MEKHPAPATRSSCHACHEALALAPPIGRREVCPVCGADLRCCLNCAHHAAEAYNACREPQEERVLSKDKSNACDFFLFRSFQGQREEKAPASAAKAKLESLFRKG